MTNPPSANVPNFESVLGEDWTRLGAIVRRHYSLRPFTREAVTVCGTMDEVWHSAVNGRFVRCTDRARGAP